MVEAAAQARPPPHPLELGLMLAHHFDQELKQEIGSLLGGGTADQSLRLGGFTRRVFDLLVHGRLTHSRSRRSARPGPGRAARATSVPYNAIRPDGIVMPAANRRASSNFPMTIKDVDGRACPRTLRKKSPM